MTAIHKGFTAQEGPFVKSLDDALASFNVERQAYYGGTFVGNHVHRALKVYLFKQRKCKMLLTSLMNDHSHRTSRHSVLHLCMLLSNDARA